ncbi:hypothetical protein SprV_0100130100 [Sparganum proliferum]
MAPFSTVSHRPFLPPSLHHKIFSSLHTISHPGSQSTYKLVSTASSGLGCTCVYMTTYQLTAKGMVERFRRQLMTSLRAVDDPENWTNHLSLVLSSIRSSQKSDLASSAAEPPSQFPVRCSRQLLAVRSGILPTLRKETRSLGQELY